MEQVNSGPTSGVEGRRFILVKGGGGVKGQPGSSNWILTREKGHSRPKDEMEIGGGCGTHLEVPNLTSEKVLVIINNSCPHLSAADALQPHTSLQQAPSQNLVYKGEICILPLAKQKNCQIQEKANKQDCIIVVLNQSHVRHTHKNIAPQGYRLS